MPVRLPPCAPPGWDALRGDGASSTEILQDERLRLAFEVLGDVIGQATIHGVLGLLLRYVTPVQITFRAL